MLSILDYGPRTALEAWGTTRIIAGLRLLSLVPHLVVAVLLILAFGLIGAAI